MSTSQRPLSSKRAEDGGGAVQNRRALTLEYRDSNGFEGRVTALRPRKRAKYSHRRMACMVWRVHRGTCSVVIKLCQHQDAKGLVVGTHPLHPLPCELVQLVAQVAVLGAVKALCAHRRHGAF